MDLRSRVVIWVLAALVTSFGFERGADAEQKSKMLYVDATHPKAQLFGACSSPQVPCRRITDALAQAREIRFEQMQEPGYSEDTVRPIVIEVEPGDYVGTYGPNPGNALEDLPLLLNVPKVTIRGKTVMNFDASGLPVSVVGDTRTIVRSQETLSAGQFLIGILQTMRNSDGTITLGNGAVVENLVIVRAGARVLNARRSGVSRSATISSGTRADRFRRAAPCAVSGREPSRAIYTFTMC